MGRRFTQMTLIVFYKILGICVDLSAIYGTQIYSDDSVEGQAIFIAGIHKK